MSVELDSVLNAIARLEIDEQNGPLGQRIYASLRDSILDLSYPPGTLLRKRALCEQFGASRSPVAEALNRLSSDGLVYIVPQSATRVTCLSLAELREESFLREAVEVAAVARVAANRTDDQLIKLTRNLRLQGLLAEGGDFRRVFEADLEFHELILGFTGYSRVVAVAGQMSLQLRRARLLVMPEPGRPAESVTEHRAIFDAIRARDPDAARSAMTTHLRQLIYRIEPLEREHPEFFAKPEGPLG